MVEQGNNYLSSNLFQLHRYIFWILLVFLSGVFVSMHAWDRIGAFFFPDSNIFPWLAAFMQMAVGLYIAYRVSSFNSRLSIGVAILSILVVIVAYSLIFPPLNRGEIYENPSDRDEALNVATSALVSGQYPYTATGVVEASGELVGLGGNPISPLPGALILAAPFVVFAGEGSWQNFLWIALFWLSLAWHFGRKNSLLAGYASGALVLLLSSPTVTASEILAGGDLLAISLALLVSCIYVQKVSSNAAVIFFCIICGLSVATRPHFFLFLPLLFFSLLRKELFLAVGRTTLISCVAVGITIPFWLWSPANFSPLHASGIILRFSDVLSHPNYWLYGGLLVAVSLLGYFVLIGRLALETATGILFLLPSIFFTVLLSIQSGGFEWYFAFYGLTGWLFLVYSGWRFFVEKGLLVTTCDTSESR